LLLTESVGFLLFPGAFIGVVSPLPDLKAKLLLVEVATDVTVVKGKAVAAVGVLAALPTWIATHLPFLGLRREYGPTMRMLSRHESCNPPTYFRGHSLWSFYPAHATCSTHSTHNAPNAPNAFIAHAARTIYTTRRRQPLVVFSIALLRSNLQGPQIPARIR
jgi:hypothetical protein